MTTIGQDGQSGDQPATDEAAALARAAAVLAARSSERGVLLDALRNNPFGEIDRARLGSFDMAEKIRSAECDLLVLRQIAAKMAGRRVAVFCMPKSGSSFVQDCIFEAARIPFLSLTSIIDRGRATSSRYGINGREQEIDELALILQTFRGHGSWVAQHHTRFNAYMAAQLRFFRIRPVVTVRNIFDAIVSFDDMLARSPRDWRADPPFALPAGYDRMDPADRYALLAQDYGLWLIQFLLSWQGAIKAGLCDPLVISYERDILNPPLFAQRLGDYLAFDDLERELLDRHLAQQPGSKARFNKGVAGRGAAVPEGSQAMLRTYAAHFRDELGDEGKTLLFAEAE